MFFSPSFSIVSKSSSRNMKMLTKKMISRYYTSFYFFTVTILIKELSSPPSILPRSSVNHHPTSHVFSLHPTEDLFTALGPIETFSAMRRLGKPRDIHLIKQEGGLGFCLRGEYPSRVGWVEEGSMAEVRMQ